MSLVDVVRGLLGATKPRESQETVAALRAVRTIAESVANDEPPPDEALRTVHRVLKPSFEDLYRQPRQARR